MFTLCPYQSFITIYCIHFVPILVTSDYYVHFVPISATSRNTLCPQQSHLLYTLFPYLSLVHISHSLHSSGQGIGISSNPVIHNLFNTNYCILCSAKKSVTDIKKNTQFRNETSTEWHTVLVLNITGMRLITTQSYNKTTLECHSSYKE